MIVLKVGFQANPDRRKKPPRFTKNQNRLIKWLRSYPSEMLEEMVAISRMAHQESRETPANHAPDMATMMKRPHIVAAIALGKKYGRVQKFNALVIELNKARLDAFLTGERSDIDRAQTPITDIGIALREVLKEFRGQQTKSNEAPETPAE